MCTESNFILTQYLNYTSFLKLFYIVLSLFRIHSAYLLFWTSSSDACDLCLPVSENLQMQCSAQRRSIML